MRYNEILANRVREQLVSFADVEEKEMFGGLVFMVNGKMCIGVMKDELMLRIDPEQVEKVVERNGCSQMMMKARLMTGYITVEEVVLPRAADLFYWINLALAYNPIAKTAKKRK